MVNYYHAIHLEEKHRKGYELQPVGNNEFAMWEAEQDWGDSLTRESQAELPLPKQVGSVMQVKPAAPADNADNR